MQYAASINTASSPFQGFTAHSQSIQAVSAPGTLTDHGNRLTHGSDVSTIRKVPPDKAFTFAAISIVTQVAMYALCYRLFPGLRNRQNKELYRFVKSAFGIVDGIAVYRYLTWLKTQSTPSNNSQTLSQQLSQQLDQEANTVTSHLKNTSWLIKLALDHLRDQN
jgi:hypothetical protein